jgi:MFS family permease
MIAASLSLGMATGQYLFGEYSDQLGANKTGQIAALIACAGGLISSAQIFPHPG